MLGKVTLNVISGPIRGQSFAFEEHDTFVFGRAEDCHAQLASDDMTASRHHFLLEVNPPDARVRDLGSLNGTYVNGNKQGGRALHERAEDVAGRAYPEVDLNDGDEIEVGDTVFRVSIAVPALCAGCGEEIPDKFKKLCRQPDGTYLCPSCEEAGVVSASAGNATARCEQCGKDVSDEIGAVRRGSYLCIVCQASAQGNPLSVLVKQLLDEAAPGAATGLGSIPGFQIAKQLGEGGMGAVYFGTRESDGVPVAIKVMLAKVAVDEDSRQRFLREIGLHAALDHPNIVKVLERGSAGSAFYFAMELCPGGSVQDLWEARGYRMLLAESGPIMLDALAGLAHAHDAGFVHRDLKPANILLTARECGVAKLADFGLAKSFEQAGLSGFTQTGAYAGTSPYMPREQVINFKRVRPATDVWSMGATLYAMLTGEFPRNFTPGRDPIEVVLHDPIVPVRDRDPSIAPALASVIDRALAEKEKDRYQNAREFRSELERVL